MSTFYLTIRRIIVVAAANVLSIIAALLVFEGTVRICVPDIHEIGTDSRLAIDSSYRTTAALHPSATGLSDGVTFRVDHHGF
jgi:hypothetical protein